MNSRIKLGAQLTAVTLCALALKYFYSTASPDELRWILAPTTTLVGLLSGRSFAFESHAGYMSSDNRFLIAASCAGVNFLLASFLMLTLRKFWLERSKSSKWRSIPVSAIIAYVFTIIANTSRICIALEMQDHPLRLDGLNGNQIHRLEGIVVYFVFLTFLFLLTERMEQGRSSELIKFLFFPLAIYYGTTLGLPFLNGAYKQGAPFIEHVAFVIAVPLVLVLPVITFGWVRRSLTKKGEAV